MPTAYNPTRGCGTLRRGGFYGQGGMAEGGVLAPWTWAEGDGLQGGNNLHLSLPARQMTIGLLRETLMTGRFVGVEGERISERDMPPQIACLPRYALFDHIGANNYSAWSFAAEAFQHGVSRRIPEDIARQVAQLAPIPIVFTHSIMLTVSATTEYYADDPYEDSYNTDLMRWAQNEVGSSLPHLTDPLYTYHGADPANGTDTYGYQIGASYHDPEWGIEKRKVGDDLQYRRAYNGGLHWQKTLIAALDAVGGGQTEQQLYKKLPAEFHDSVTVGERVAGIAWITQASYIKVGDETADRLAELEKANIVALDLDGVSDDADEENEE